jgi:hypothetical protein
MEEESNNNKIIPITSNELNNNKIISITNDELKKNIYIEGKNILQENDFFNNLDIIMSDNNFRSFYNTYFKDFIEIKVVILYMKLYETIQIEYEENNGIPIEKELLAYMIKELMSNSESRKYIYEAFYNFTDNKQVNNKYILDIFYNNQNIKKLKN